MSSRVAMNVHVKHLKFAEVTFMHLLRTLFVNYTGTGAIKTKANDSMLTTPVFK